MNEHLNLHDMINKNLSDIVKITVFEFATQGQALSALVPWCIKIVDTCIKTKQI